MARPRDRGRPRRRGEPDPFDGRVLERRPRPRRRGIDRSLARDAGRQGRAVSDRDGRGRAGGPVPGHGRAGLAHLGLDAPRRRGDRPGRDPDDRRVPGRGAARRLRRFADRGHPRPAAVRAARALPGAAADVRPDRDGGRHLRDADGSVGGGRARVRGPRARAGSPVRRLGVPVDRDAGGIAARRRPPARSHLRRDHPVRRPRHGVRDARVRAARAPGRAAGAGRDRHHRPAVPRARGGPVVDGRAHAVRRRLRARRRPLLRPAERVHRPADRRLPLGGPPAPNLCGRRAPGGGSTVRRPAVPRLEPRRRGLAVRRARAVGRRPRTRTPRRVEGHRRVRRLHARRPRAAAPGARDLAVRDARDPVRGAGGRAGRRDREVRGPAAGRVRPDRPEPVRADPGARSARHDRCRPVAAGSAPPEPARQPGLAGRDPGDPARGRGRLPRERLRPGRRRVRVRAGPRRVARCVAPVGSREDGGRERIRRSRHGGDPAVTTQPLPPRPDGLHPAPPIPPLPPRPDPADGVGPTLDGAQGVAARPKATWSWYEAVGIYILGFLVAGLVTIPLINVMTPDTDLTNIVLSVVAALAILAVLLVWLSRYHKGWVRIIGLPAKGEWGRQAGAGAVSGLVLFPVITIVVGGIVSLILRAITGNEVQPPEQVGEHLSAVGTVLTVVYAFVIAPIGEELFFRGVLFRSIRDRHGFWAGAVGSAFGFGLIHFVPGNGADAALVMVAMFFTGLGLCYVYERRGTLVASIAAHMTFNVIGIVLIFGLR